MGDSPSVQIAVDFSELRSDISSIKEDVAEIKQQTTKTNGRVSALEVARKIDEALRVERAAMVAQVRERRAWMPNGAVGAGLVVLGFALQHFFG